MWTMRSAPIIARRQKEGARRAEEAAKRAREAGAERTRRAAYSEALRREIDRTAAILAKQVMTPKRLKQ